jgi:hypothetical protein
MPVLLPLRQGDAQERTIGGAVGTGEPATNKPLRKTISNMV